MTTGEQVLGNFTFDNKKVFKAIFNAFIREIFLTQKWRVKRVKQEKIKLPTGKPMTEKTIVDRDSKYIPKEGDEPIPVIIVSNAKIFKKPI